jgi:hypothetical protein
MARKPTRTNLSVLAQLCNLIPAFLVSTTAREFGVDKKARTFSPWSHVVALLFAQFTHALSLNDACDALKNHAAKLLRIRRAVAPSKNAFSHANRQRDGEMAQALLWRCSRDARGTGAAVFARLGATPGARMSRPHLPPWDSQWPF